MPFSYLGGGDLTGFVWFSFSIHKTKNVLNLTVRCSPGGCLSVSAVFGNMMCCVEQCPALLGTTLSLPVILQLSHLFYSAVFQS